MEAPLNVPGLLRDTGDMSAHPPPLAVQPAQGKPRGQTLVPHLAAALPLLTQHFGTASVWTEATLEEKHTVEECK